MNKKGFRIGLVSLLVVCIVSGVFLYMRQSQPSVYAQNYDNAMPPDESAMRYSQIDVTRILTETILYFPITANKALLYVTPVPTNTKVVSITLEPPIFGMYGIGDDWQGAWNGDMSRINSYGNLGAKVGPAFDVLIPPTEYFLYRSYMAVPVPDNTVKASMFFYCEVVGENMSPPDYYLLREGNWNAGSDLSNLWQNAYDANGVIVAQIPPTCQGYEEVPLDISAMQSIVDEDGVAYMVFVHPEEHINLRTQTQNEQSTKFNSIAPPGDWDSANSEVLITFWYEEQS